MQNKKTKKSYCYSCKKILSKFDIELNQKYPSYSKKLMCTSCLKDQENRLSKEISKLSSDDTDFYNY